MAENTRRIMPIDRNFFADHPDRRFRIRKPLFNEYAEEFRSLGPHQYDRRRIIAARVDARRARHFGMPIIRIPFLAFADESIEDTDTILKPIFRQILTDAADKEGKEVVF